MAAWFKGLFGPKLSSTPSRTIFEDVYQKITDNQPQNIYREVLLLCGHSGSVKHLVNISNLCFVSAGDDGRLIVWNSERGHQLHVLEGHTRPITTILVLNTTPSDCNDETLILSASSKEMILWELSSDERFDPESNIKVITEHEGSVNCLTTLNYGLVCSGGKDLCLWDITSGKLLSKYDRSKLEGDNSDVFSVLELEGRNFGIIAVSKYHQPAVFDIKKSTVTHTASYELLFCCYLLSFHHQPISYLAPVSGSLFVTGAEDGTVVIWSMNSLSAVKKFECTEEESELTASVPPTTPSALLLPGPSPVTYIMVLCERYMFIATGNGFKSFDVYSSEGSQFSNEVHSMPKPIMVNTQAHVAPITHMEFLPESYMLLTSSEDGAVRLWGTQTPPIKKESSPPLDTSTVSSKLKYSVEVFLGIQAGQQHPSKNRRRHLNPTFPVVPILLGELCLHSGSVQVVLNLGCDNGLATCGDDGMVLLWKNLELENQKRDLEIQKFLKGEMFFDATS